MKCLITSVLEKAENRKKPLSVIARYIRLKYKIMVDEGLLRKRQHSLKMA
jgi:hypothetical protein